MCEIQSPMNSERDMDINKGKKPVIIKTAAAAASSSDKHCVFHKMPKCEEADAAFAQVRHPAHATGEDARSFTVTTRRGKRTIHHYVEDNRDALRARERARARASASAAGEDGGDDNDDYRYALNEDPYFKDHAARALANGCKVKLTASTMVIEQKPKSRDEYQRSLPPRFLQKLTEMEAQAKK
ncbi:uncharacterized protein LOC118483860 isoform X1 [Helianthus annuus]|uniref:uncharacterized protein LOC118483860 isoform X1 n=1 Tax=Helianthus annuus TaxID=4232 RepID=UPI001652CE83|nr:uncharacterized protein LOC118483860 isoform X1 [Helianthus annuus]XP_035835412.1 uncharacterized protein LOC118483860 isoform X1 [Helianthus annuus]